MGTNRFLFLVWLYLLVGYDVAVTASTIAASLHKETIGLLHRQAKRRASSSKSLILDESKNIKGVDVRGGGRSLAKKAGSSNDASSGRRRAALEGLRSGMASGMAAACVKTLLQPLDVMKTLQQYQQTSSQKALSTVEAARILWSRPGGIANFYAGLGVTVLGSIPGVALYFGVYQFAKQRFREQTEWGQEHPRVAIALAAALGNSVASATRVPYEVLKQKLQMGAYESFSVMVKAVLANPIEALFPKGGILIQTIRDVPYAIATLLVYESLQEAVRERTGTSSPKLKKQWDFIIGGISGGIGSWVTNPMDVLKTRLQTDTINQYDGSILKCTALVWKEGGASAFLRGAVPRLMHKVPANCFFFLFYEMFRRLLNADGSVAPDTREAKK